MGRLKDLVGMLAERRLGFRTDETMKGTHTFVRDFEPGKVKAGTKLPFQFQATWGTPHLDKFLNPLSGDFMFALMEGKVTAGGLTGEAPLKGTLEMRYFENASIRYTFEFEAQGHAFRYVGEKTDIRPWNLHRTHTICRGTLTDLTTDQLLSESEVKFNLSQLPWFLSRFRLG